MKKIFLVNNKLIKQKKFNYYYLNKYWKSINSNDLYIPLYADTDSKRNKIERDTKKIYNKLILVIKKFFNFSFNLKYDSRDYEILVGFFLINLSRLIAGRNNKIKYIIDKKIFNFAISSNNFKYLFFYDTLDFNEAIIKNSKKNLHISEFITQELIKNFFQKKIKIIAHKEKVTKSNKTIKSKELLIEKFKDRILKVFSSITYRKTDYIIYNSFLNWKENFLLQLKLGQIPSFWKQVKYEKFDLDIKFRKKLYENFIENQNIEKEDLKYFDIFYKLVPTCYIEGFKKNLINSKKIKWSIKSKLLFTSNAFAYDEIFKYWTFKNKFYNQIVVGQHGCNYGTAKYRINPAIEEIIYKSFLTWGWQNHGKNVRGFHFTSNLINKKKNIKNDKILLVLDNMRGEFLYDEIYDYEKEIFNNLKLLNTISSFYKNITVKTHNNEGNFFNETKILSKLKIKSLKIVNNQFKLTKLININDVVLFTYDATDFFNCLIANKPCIVFLNKGYFNIKKKYRKFYNYLESVNIVFTDYKKLNEHLSSIYKKGIENWWFSSETQKKIQMFNLQLNKGTKYKVKDLSNILKRL